MQTVTQQDGAKPTRALLACGVVAGPIYIVVGLFQVLFRDGFDITVAGLVAGAAGIAVLWASGVEFPIAIPPGLVILLVGVLFVGLDLWRWATGVGAFLGLFVTLGFLISGGIPNLVGGDGSTFFGTPNPVDRDTLGTIIGTWIQMIGVLTALIAGVIATRNNYRKPTQARQ